MRVVIDTNIVISGIFFNGVPRAIIEAVVDGEVKASATPEIVEEYVRVVVEMIARKQGHLRKDLLGVLVSKFDLVEPLTKVEICRDPDDDKFIGCALDANACYIVSGDKDLLDIGDYKGIKIVTAAEFCVRFMGTTGTE